MRCGFRTAVSGGLNIRPRRRREENAPLPAAVSGYFASERYPALQGLGQTQQEIMAVIGKQLRHALSVSGRVCASSIAASCSGVQRPTAGSRRFAGGVRSDNHRCPDLPQIEWSLKTESLTAVYQSRQPLSSCAVWRLCSSVSGQ